MDLESFVTQVISSLVKGVRHAGQEVEGTGGAVNPETYGNGITAAVEVEFDVALTVESSGTTGAGGKIAVMGFGVGGKIEDSNRNMQVSRVRFNVPVMLPSQPKKGKAGL